MEEEEITYGETATPKLHDRWSLLTLGVAFTGDVVQLAADYLATMAVMSVQHGAQKRCDKTFREITDGYTR